MRPRLEHGACLGDGEHADVVFFRLELEPPVVATPADHHLRVEIPVGHDRVRAVRDVPEFHAAAGAPDEVFRQRVRFFDEFSFVQIVHRERSLTIELEDRVIAPDPDQLREANGGDREVA